MKVLNDGVTFFENNPTIQLKDGKILIIDDTPNPVNGLDRENTVSIYIVQANRSSSSKIIYYKLIQNSSEQRTIELDPTDGYLQFCHIVLPLEDYKGSSIYYSDGRYVYKNGQRLNDLQELVEINTNEFIRHTHNFFSVFHLRKCYVSLCQKVFNDRGFDRCFNGKVDSSLIYKRDLVWAALNVIQYMIDFNQLAEAQRLLERINGCNGLCSSEDTGDKGCGCE